MVSGTPARPPTSPSEACLCSYIDSGLCYVTGIHGRPDIPGTVDVTARQAVAHAAAGADIVGPASMVLGTTQGARTALVHRRGTPARPRGRRHAPAGARHVPPRAHPPGAGARPANVWR
ncbi:hypothetical protein [Streptomyces sp. NPDC019937]|uniref:hypothetical protein n=1 Tax=Streptomyces sp. NPDC019937 TaxID=3154787 RepID=UPI0033E89688